MSQTTWAVLLTALKIIYGICIVVLSLYGFNSIGLAVLYLVTQKKASKEQVCKQYNPLVWPKVTIQLPMYNESVIVDRLLKAVTAQDYPRDCYEIQVLDDSTDETTNITDKLVRRYQSQGWDICLVHRDHRTGYKAGALAEGLMTAKGDFIAIFDADFVPPPEWLRTMMGCFDDPRVGCVQSRWGHLNSRYNLLTNAETLGLDGHFIVEQNARSRNNLYISFNGSGGIWRKECIEDAGGWQADTLTEDLDLSYRAQLKGWRITYRPDVIVPGELPAQVDAFKNQQYRWAKGSAQALVKLTGPVLKARAPWYKRVMGLIHLSMYLPFPFMVFTVLLTLPIALIDSSFMKYFSFTILAGLGPPILYTVGKTSHLPRFRDRLVRLPALLLIGIGISLNSAFAVLSGIFTKGGVFTRTPKYNIHGRKGNWAKTKYALPTNPVVWGEVLIGLYALYTVYTLWHTATGRAIAPGMIYYAISYFFMASLSFMQSWQLRRARAEV